MVLHPLGNGFISIGHKPGGKISFEMLKEHGITVILTLLNPNEGALMIQNKASKLGMDWIWFPFSVSNPHHGVDLQKVINLYIQLSDRLNHSQVIYIHCSAGIHRTGMITYGLLRFLGNSQEEAREILFKLRPVTSDQAGNERLKWGDQFFRV